MEAFSVHMKPLEKTDYAICKQDPYFEILQKNAAKIRYHRAFQVRLALLLDSTTNHPV